MMEEEIVMNPIGVFMAEHRLIERMVELMNRELGKIRQGGKAPDLVFLDGVLDFAKTYADACHHGKEESILFDTLAMKNLSSEHKKQMDELVLDHIRNRRIINGLENAREAYLKGEPEGADSIVAVSQSFADFYPGHMEKEEEGFFPIAMDYLSRREQQEMVKRFWDFDRELLLEKYLKFMDRYDR